MDCDAAAQVNYLFSVSVPKLLVMYSHRDAALYHSALQTVLPLAKKYLNTVKVRSRQCVLQLICCLAAVISLMNYLLSGLFLSHGHLLRRHQIL